MALREPPTLRTLLIVEEPVTAREVEVAPWSVVPPATERVELRMVAPALSAPLIVEEPVTASEPEVVA